MARQWTAKQAIDAQNGVTPPVTPVAPTTPTPINTPAPVAPAPITPPTVPAQPRVEGQWNYGTADNQVLWEKPTVTPPQPTPTVKPASASEAIAQGFKQEIKPVAKGANAPLTTEIGREAKLGQLPTVQQAQNQAEQDRINTSNLKSQSGQQLWSNLESISGANSSLLNDRNAFNKAFGYDGKDVSEKALVDAFWKSKRLDANSIYGAISTGATIPNESKNTPAFTDALIRHQDTTRFENLNPYQLSKVINSELIPWTQTYNDLMAKNPQLVTDAMKLASINTPVTARQETSNWQDNLSNYLSRSPVMSNPTTVATIMNSDPNIATKTNEVQAVEDKLTEAKDRLKNIQKNVTERYKGTGATKQTVNAKALAESQDIIDEITMLEANKASASSALTTLIQNAKDNYTMARQDRQDALAQYNQGFQQLQALADMGMKQDSLAYQQQKDATERDLGLLQYYTNIDQANAKEARGYDFQEQSDLRNFGQQKELAKMGYQNQYNLSNLGFNQDMAKLGMQQSYSTAQNANQNQMDMIKAAMSQGATYQDAVNQVMGTGGQQTQVGNLSGAELMKVLASGKLNGNKFFGVYATADMDGTDRANIYNKAENMGLDAFVNQYKGTKITPEMINIAAQKTGMDPLMIATVMAADSSMGTKWLGAKNNNPWNVGQFDSLGTQWVAGYKTLQDGVNAVAENLQKRVNALIPKLPKSNQSVGQTTAPKEVSANAKSWVDSWDKGTMDLETILTKIGSSKEAAPLKNEVMQYVASRWGVAYRPPTDSNVVQLQKKIDELDELIANDEQMENVSWKWQMSPWDNLTSKKQDYLSRVDNILQWNVLQKLIDAKDGWATFGALSNEELKMLQSASSPLMGRALKDNDKVTWYDLSTPEMKRQLQLLRDWYAASIAKMTGANQWQSAPVNSPVTDATKARLEQLKASRNK